MVEAKAGVREELRVMFSDYRHPIPKSRLKTIKIKAENGKFQRVPGPTHEEFSPSNRDHVLGALTQRGILVENTQEATLKKLDAPECRLLLKYAAVKKRLEAIKGITRSSFSDGTGESRRLESAFRPHRDGSLPRSRICSKCRGTGAPDSGWSRRSFGSKGDLSQIEMVLIAIVTGDRNLIELLRSGRDVYVEYGARIFGKKAERGPGDDQITDRLRDVAKVPTLGNFLRPHAIRFRAPDPERAGNRVTRSRRPRGFSKRSLRCSLEIAAYHARRLRTLSAWTVFARLAEPGAGFLRLSRIASGDYWPSFERRKKILVNTPIQGSGADLVIWAVNRFMP